MGQRLFYLHGRVRHTKLPKTSGLLPLFEAVVNSIHSIEEADLVPGEGKIVVEILRDVQSSFDYDADHNRPGRDPVEDIIGFKIIDNGIGFNDINLESFKTLDSEHKANKGCRGVGRLLWLKVFDSVTVNSVYKDANASLRRRVFDFTANSGVVRETDEVAQNNVERVTCIHLNGFAKAYRDASRKTAETISKCLFEHCLWYFVRPGGTPEIILKDGTETIFLDQIYEVSMHSLAVSEIITLKDINFELTHVKLQGNSAQSHSIAFCAASRLVKEENIKGKVPGLYGRIEDEEGDFVYSCYVSSPYLDENVRSERTGFDIDDDVSGLFEESQISFGEIRDAVVERATNHLSAYLQESKRKGRERVELFVSEKAPRYRPILSRIPDDLLVVDPNMSDKDLDILLHKHLAEIERQLLSDGHDIMVPLDREAWPDYKKRLNEYLSTAEDIKKSDLANYVSHRKVILDLLEKAIERDKNGKYAREDLIHGLLMPMRTGRCQGSCRLCLDC